MAEHIKIRNTPPRVQYVADGKTASFEVPFAIFDDADIKVYVNDEERSSFTITHPSNDVTNVVFNSTPADGQTITILRNLAIERTTDFQECSALRASVLNDELDYQMACLQQVADELNRSMVLPPYSLDTDVVLTLPSPDAGKSIIWGEDGKSLINSDIEINKLTREINENVATAVKAAEDAANTVEGIISDRFLVREYIGNCILEAPNGMVTYSGISFTVKAGLKVLMPNGKNADGTLKNIEFTLGKDFTSSSANGSFTFLLGSDSVVYGVTPEYLSYSETAPTNGTRMFWYNPKTHIWKFMASAGSSWETKYLVPIFKTTASSGVITSLTPYAPIEVCNIKGDVGNQLNGAGVRTVIKEYASGTTWYRIWSDGFIEQGGRIASAAVVTFPTPFKTTNINIQCTLYSEVASFACCGARASTVTTTSALIWTRNYSTSDTFSSIIWEAKGY